MSEKFKKGIKYTLLSIAIPALFTIAISLYLNHPDQQNKTLEIGALKAWIHGDFKPLIVEKPPSPNNNASIDCSNLQEFWKSDGNVEIQENKVVLKDGYSAGSVLSNKTVSSLFELDIRFKSSLTTGVNVALTIGDGREDKIKYAIGDGDFKSVRTYLVYSDEPAPIIQESKKLEPEINQTSPILFHIETTERTEGFTSVASLKYNNNNGNKDLKSIESANLRPRLTLWFGLDRTREPGTQEAQIEILECDITEKERSSIL